ncbi:MAG: hypothetical protein ACJ739_03235 [Acidimicrobiales bacterium]
MAGIDHTAIAARAGQQLGLITRSQLLAMGITRRQIQTAERAGFVRRAAAGVWAVSAVPTSPEQRLLAAALAAGPDATISHLAAAWVWRFDGVKPTGIEISVPRRRNPRLAVGRLHRVSDLLAVDVTQRGPLPVTTAARTMLDIAGLVDPRVLEESLDGARRRGQIYLPFLRWRLAALRRSGRPGVAALEALLALELTSDRAESWLESAFLRVIRDFWLPPPRVQVVKTSGRWRVRLDAFYDDQRLVAEVGGHGTHASRRERQRDAERRARLAALGLRVVDFTYEDVTERPAYIATTLGELLGIEPFAA